MSRGFQVPSVSPSQQAVEQPSDAGPQSVLLHRKTIDYISLTVLPQLKHNAINAIIKLPFFACLAFPRMDSVLFGLRLTIVLICDSSIDLLDTVS
jgi:hypothetical protein